MRYTIGHLSVVGPIRKNNEDSLCYKQAIFDNRKIVMAVITDGMGGMECGQIASATVTRAFYEWFDSRIGEVLSKKECEEIVINEWRRLIGKLNQKINGYGCARGIKLGTTVSALLIIEGRYVIGHVGDSRIYKIGTFCKRLTDDQSLKPGSNVLLECVGASEVVHPLFYRGNVKGSKFILCSDGFWHKNDFYIRHSGLALRLLLVGLLRKKEKYVVYALDALVRRAIKKGENDNISAIWIC